MGKSLDALINKQLNNPIGNISLKIMDNGKGSETNKIAEKFSDIFLESSYATSFRDGTFRNPVMKTGTADFAGSAGEYELTLITYNRYLITAIYNANWVFRRIIDKIAQDMWSTGIDITSTTDPDKIKLVYTRFNRLRSELIYATKQARLYGGAGALMMVDDGETDLTKPLNLRNIKKGARITLQSTDRWYDMETSSELVTNYRNPDFNTPKYYTFMFGTNKGAIKVHHTRVLRFVNRKSPRLIQQLLQGWGVSELEHIYQELLNHDNTKANTAALVSKALLEIVQISGMRGIMSGLSMGNTQQEAVLAGQIAGINNYRASNNLVFLDKDDSYHQEAYSFSGLSEILTVQKENVAGAAEMPQVLLYGDTKGGMTSDSPAEMEFYAQTIKGKQEEELRPVIDKLLPVLFRIAGLEIPKDLDYEFESIAGMPQDRKLNQLNTTVSTVTTLLEAGLITKETALKEIQEVQKLTGFGSNISEKDFDLAKKQDVETDDMGDDEEIGAEETFEEAPVTETTLPKEDDYSDIKENLIKAKTRIYDSMKKVLRHKR